jgi:hypothetical protein
MDDACFDPQGYGYNGAAAPPRAFVQWKNTDICMDFTCDCGASLHFDGYFAYVLKCPDCDAEWQMPTFVYPRRNERSDGIEPLAPVEHAAR